MKTRKFFLITLLVGLGSMFLIQDCAPPGTTDIFGRIVIPCDGTSRELTYTAAGVGTTVIIKVLNICSAAKIEYQDAAGKWVEPQDKHNDGTVGPITPEAGNAYAVTVTRNKKLRLTCNRGETAGDSCRFELLNASMQPASAQQLIDTLAVACGGWESAKIFNFSAIPLHLRIYWADVCKDAGPGGTRPPHVPDVGLRTTGVVGQVFRVVGVGKLTGSTAEWKGDATRNTELGVRCPGTFPGCKYVVSFIRN